MDNEHPPPLLLMPASDNVSFNPINGSNILMPVSQDSAVLSSDEADNFLGQSALSSVPLFQPPTSNSSFVTPPLSAQSSMMAATTAPSPFTAPTPPQPVSSYVAPSSLPPSVGTSYFDSTSVPPPPPSNMSHMMSSSATSIAPPPMAALSQPAPLTLNMPPMRQPAGAPPHSNTFPPPHSQSAQQSDGTFPPHGLYIPVQYHWCYCTNPKQESHQVWHAFSMSDSIKLDEAFKQGATDQVIGVEGGRYDVYLSERSRKSVYWEEDDASVRRCSWFYKPVRESRYVPYTEETAAMLENEYKTAVVTQTWHKRTQLASGESVVMHSPQSIVQYRADSQPDEWGTVQGDQHRPSVVKRGIDDFAQIEEGEAAQVDHLVFVVHGIGSTCDLKFRNIVECVNDFRSMSNQLLDSHFKQYQESGRIGRVEFLPIRWHAALHGDATGIDSRLKNITLKSIGKLRHYTNDTILDVLFYASPAYCQKIIDTVSLEMDRLYTLFLSRNEQFNGHVSVAGHSLGSLILFDILLNQRDPSMPDPKLPVEHSETDQGFGNPHVYGGSQTPLSNSSRSSSNSQEVLADQHQQPTPTASEADPDELTIDALLAKLSLTEFTDVFQREQIDMETLIICEESDIKELGLPMGPRKKLLAYLKEQKQNKTKTKDTTDLSRPVVNPTLPISSVVNPGIDTTNARYPLMRSASNTPINYLVGSGGIGLPLVRHPQLSFTPTNFFALGSPIGMFMTVRGVESLGEEFAFPTCPGFFNIFHPFDPVAYRIEPLVTASYPPKPALMPHHKGRKRMHLELKESLTRMGTDLKQKIIDSVKTTWQTLNSFAAAHKSGPIEEMTTEEVDDILKDQLSQEQQDQLDETGSICSSFQEEDTLVGQLNQGRRIDYVLQEKPIESFNDYLFALGSHACYWESEDTVLLIMKEIYAAYGIAPQRPGAPPKPMLYAPGANIPQDSSSHPPPPPMSGFGSVSSMAPPPAGPSHYPQKHPSLAHNARPSPAAYLPTQTTTSVLHPTLVSPPSVGQSMVPTQAPPTNAGPPPLSGFVRK